jgi:flagellar biogenesis protein FliO
MKGVKISQIENLVIISKRGQKLKRMTRIKFLVISLILAILFFIALCFVVRGTIQTANSYQKTKIILPCYYKGYNEWR